MKRVLNLIRSRCSVFALAATAALVAAAPASAQFSNGPDVVYSDISSISTYGPVGNIYAYAFGSHTCNIGNQNLRWGFTWAGTPAFGHQAYRYFDGRMMQIGIGHAKHSCCAAAGPGCGLACNGQGGSVLGAGCLDVYGSGWNGSWSNLGPRADINAYTGVVAGSRGGSGTAIYKRLQIDRADMDPANYPGAIFYAEGLYVASDDAPIGNNLNNASYRRVNVAANFGLTPTGTTTVGRPAITAWPLHNPNVELKIVDVPNEGRFYVAYRVVDNQDGTWLYDYAVYNLTSHRSLGSFEVPVPKGAAVSDFGFHDVNYHSGEPFDNTDWSANFTGCSVRFASPQTFAENPNSNALRWGTMYNFWFTADVPPTRGDVDLGLFRPGTPDAVSTFISVPSTPPCLADWDGNGVINAADTGAFLTSYFDDVANGTTSADLDCSGETNPVDVGNYLNHYFKTLGECN